MLGGKGLENRFMGSDNNQGSGGLVDRGVRFLYQYGQTFIKAFWANADEFLLRLTFTRGGWVMRKHQFVRIATIVIVTMVVIMVEVEQ